MSRFQFVKPITRVLLASTALTVMFGAGVGAGFYFYPQFFLTFDDHDAGAHVGGQADHDDHDEEHDHEEEDHEEEDHVALTEQAFGNLQLKMGHVNRGDYWKSVLVPAQVVEIPGRSDLSVSAPIAGVVSKVLVLPGQSLLPKQTLFEMQVTDQSLTEAQSRLLDVLTRLEVVQQEVARLAPLAKDGVVSGAKKRGLEYELKQLKAQQATLVQELRGRGLPEAMIGQILKDKQMATTLTVYAPDFVQAIAPGQALSSTGYSIEHLRVHPGKSVVRGTDLCSVAYHAELYIQGTAFEDDLPILNKIAENDWDISVELHGIHGGHTARDVLNSVKLLRVDNHVDQKTQSVHFYAGLRNSVTRTKKSRGQSFEQWRFRPGQRLHLRLPVERWENQIILPADAVVVDGPNVIVFAEHHHEDDHEDDHEDEMPVAGVSPSTQMASVESVNDGEARLLVGEAHDDHDDHDHEVFIELEPVPLRLLYRDDHSVVIADDGQIDADMEIALNNAQKLYLAMKMQAEGGGGHHHHHDH